MSLIKELKEIDKRDISFAGGKGANLGELLKINIPVPAGFVVAAQAFEKFLAENNINVEIKAMWDKINIRDIKSLEENSEIVRTLIIKTEMPKQVAKEILDAFKALNTKYVAVRSSATAEDSSVDSWAGELETYLNTTKDKLILNVRKCWASLYTPKALFYRIKRGLKGKKISVAVVVQKMVQSEVSGACFTVHPFTKDKNQIIIEAVKGIGEILVQGRVTPDSYVLTKDNLESLNINIPQGQKQKLTQKQIKELAKLCIKIENHYKTPQDIEWVLRESKFYIVQTRPITTL